ncbi:hypothetical protein Cgig2_032877 [Carnegiea gigantea]|uniref:Uncharacterized protein n=1 Tax=Carnegiea gigantea TaxID=171969 RepID=A0A9Q1JLV7_9CARY|nr:hypothetical protein Cgig2_032877 [Carnegiea gigantea]
MPAPAFIPQVRSQDTSVVNTIRYGGWTDDSTCWPSHPAENVVYEVSNATTANHSGFTSRVPPVTCQDVCIYVWNCRGLARASFRPNLFTMTSITGAYVVLLIDTRVGSRNAQRLRDEAHLLHYYYREPLGFVGGVIILWDNSKVELCGFTGHDMDMSCIVKAQTQVNHVTLGLEVCTFSKMFTYVHHKLTTFVVQGLV